MEIYLCFRTDLGFGVLVCFGFDLASFLITASKGIFSSTYSDKSICISFFDLVVTVMLDTSALDELQQNSLVRITPKMLEAGITAFENATDFSEARLYEPPVVRAVYIAMELARLSEIAQ